MNKSLITISVFAFSLLLFTSCGDDSMFSKKVTTKNGITTVSGIKPGTLETALSLSMRTITHLVIEDTIDSRDFQTMRDEMPKLAILDLSKATIAAYSGIVGSGGDRVHHYDANKIPDFAFYDPEKATDNKTLTSIVLPNSIKSIGKYAFHRCTGLTGALVIPANVKDTIGMYAFSFCENLTSLTLSPAKYIGESAFQGCKNLGGTLAIPDSVIYIKPFAFAGCSKFDNVLIPSSVIYKDENRDKNDNENLIPCIFNVFEGCGGVFSVDPLNTSFSSVDGVLCDFEQTKIIKYPFTNKGSYTVPSTITTIGSFAFSNCTGLTEIIIPTGLSSLEDRAFNGCSGMSGEFLINTGVSSIGEFVFEGCTNISGFTIAADNPIFSFTDGALIDITWGTLKRYLWNNSGAYILPPNITSIANGAFSDCNALTSITIHADVFGIGKGAFINCSKLSSMYLKSSLPIDLAGSLTALEGINKLSCKLFVPIGTKSIYSKAIGWKDFVNIQEMEY